MESEDSSLNEKLPVLIIGYGRLENISKLVEESLSYGASRIFVHLDLANSSDLRESQLQFVQQMDAKLGQKISFKVTKENMGVAGAVVSAIDWFFSVERLGIILEDDLSVGMNTFQFFEAAIPRFNSIERCLLIAGSTFMRESPCDTNEIMWTNFPLIWGWATSAEKWQILRNMMTRPVPRKWPVSRIRGFLTIGAYKALTCEVDTWDSPLALGMWVDRYLCIIPPKNTISNFGADSIASHTKSSTFPIGNPIIPFDVSKISFVEPQEKKIRNTNKKIIADNFQLHARHFLAPLFVQIRGKDQGNLKRKIDGA